MGGTAGEFTLIDRILARLPGDGADVVVGPGDDCAALATGGARLLLVTVDALVEDRHFVRATTTPGALGRRLAAVNLSDVAAMGGVPRWAVLSLAVPEALAEGWTAALAEGVSRGLAEHGAALVGGNLAGAPGAHGGIVADLALIGEVEPDRILRRAGARPGDVLCVTGALGRAGAGRRVLEGGLRVPPASQAGLLSAFHRPAPRIREGRALAASGAVSAAIDLSDGLASDARHLAAAGDVDLEIRLDLLPVPDGVARAAREAGLDPARFAASAGEDYELLFTVAPDRADAVAASVGEATGTAVTTIGRVAEREGARPAVRWSGPGGEAAEEPPSGWDHFAGDGR